MSDRNDRNGRMTAVLVEDEPPARRRLRRLLEADGRVTVVAEADTVRDAAAKIRHHRPDVVFLDIRLPGGDGFDVLRRLDEIPAVIFVTAYDDYAVRAFEEDAVDYLVKPVDGQRLAAALDRLARRRERDRVQPGLDRALARSAGRPFRIVARKRNRIVLLDPAEVTHLSADHTLVFAWSGGSSYLVPRTLQEMEEELAAHGFRRTHRSALVNLAHVRAVHPGASGNFVLEMDDPEGTRVPLSRRRARLVRGELGF